MPSTRTATKISPHRAPSGNWRTPIAAALGLASGWVLNGIVREITTPAQSLQHPLRPSYAVGDDQFLRTLGSLLPPPILEQNRITTLINGDEIFPAMLAAIAEARHTITMETFIYWSGRIGQVFADALAERARAGVRCHLLLDWFGSQKLDRRSMHRMHEAGVQVRRYHPRWWHITYLNHRTHRKLLVVDGQTGFIGGVGIADQWLGNAQDPRHWRDNHYQVQGPVVAQLQSAFTDNWVQSQRAVLHDEGFFPALEPAGDCACQVFQSSPEQGSDSMQLLYLLGIGAARRSIRIATAYFVPDRVSAASLIEAVRRGVNVEIIVPGPHIDYDIVRHASRARWGELLRAGVRIFEYMPTMYHTKVMIVDELWTSIGSANFDNRSFRHHDEANLNVYDRAFARRQVEWFQRDLQDCRPITLKRWKNRGGKLRDYSADLISAYL